MGQELERERDLVLDDVLDVGMHEILTVDLGDEIEDVQLGGGNGPSRHDAGPGEEVPLEIFVAAVESLVEVLLRLDLLREHLGAGAAQGPGDLVTPEGARLGEVHLHDVGEVEKAPGRRGGDDIVERDGAAARFQRPAGLEDVGVGGHVLEDLDHEEIAGQRARVAAHQGLPGEVHERLPAPRQALDAEDEEGRVDDSRRRQVGILRAEGIDEAVAEKELVGIGPARAVKDGLPRHVEIHAVLPVFSRLGRGRT